MHAGVRSILACFVVMTLGCDGDPPTDTDGGTRVDASRPDAGTADGAIDFRIEIAGTLAEPATVAVVDAGDGTNQVTLWMSAHRLSSVPTADLAALDFASAQYPAAPGCPSATWEVAVPEADLLQLALRGTDARPVRGCENLARQLARDGISLSAQNVLRGGRPVLAIVTIEPNQ